MTYEIEFKPERSKTFSPFQREWLSGSSNGSKPFGAISRAT